MFVKLLFILLQPSLPLALNFLCNPTLCPASSRGDGICDPSCMVSFCNFDSNSTSNPRLNTENSDCYQSCINNYSCSHSDLGNGICDANCNNPICGYDFGDCGYCSSNCKCYIGFLEDLNENCTSSCDNENCYYSLGSCQDCSPGCNSKMLGNSICDKICNVLSCNYDFGDCNHNQCNPDCQLWMIENNDCNEECNNLACNWDGGDCDCSPGCHSYMISNGVCDSICDVLACDYDNEDCQKCDPGCLKSMLGDGICNSACDVSDCLYDNYDCSCADGCNKENYGQCQDSCMNSLCLYDTISSNSQCQNNNQILFALHYGFIFKNLIENVSPDNCTDTTNCLSTEVLDSSSCHTSCKSNSCIYSWNKCTTYNCADSNCLVCNSDLLGDCFQCNSNTYQFYGYCLTSCPSGHEAVNLLGNYPVCLISKDYSTKDNPTIYYVTSKESTDIFGGNGSFNNPYTSLALALASIYNKYAIIYLFNNGDHYLTCVDLSNPVSTVLSDVCNPLTKSFIIKDLLIASYDNSIVSLKNKADSDLLLFTVASSTTLTIKNIAFNGKDLLSTCPSSTNQYCTYCANITLNSDGYYYNDQDARVTNFLDASLCSSYHTKQLFSVYFNAKLIMINVNVSDFRMELKSIVYSFWGNITFNNVNFDNIRCFWTDTSETQQVKSAVVYFDICEDSNYNCGSFEYTNGVVSRLNNGYEYGSAQFSGFLSADKIRTIKLKNVTFINNIVYNPYIDSNAYSLIKLSLFRSIEISHCNFIKNIMNYGFIYLSLATLEFRNDVNSKGELIDLLLYHIYIHDTIFESNSGINAGILYAIYGSQLQRILLENLLINENGILSGSLIYVYNFYNNSEYIADTEVSINDVNGNLVKAIFKKRDFIFKDSIITHNYSGIHLILEFWKLFNTHIKNLTVENNGSLNVQNINTILWSYYVADNNLYIKKLIDNPIYLDIDLLWVFYECYNYELSESVFINNTSQNNSPCMYYVDLYYANFTDVTFAGNEGSTDMWFGLTVSGSRSIRISNSTFKNNVNRIDGSGIFYFDTDNDSLYIENTIISNNSVGYFSGIYFVDGSLILNNVTIESNKARLGLGAVYFQVYPTDGNHNIEIKNSVFKENISINGIAGAIYISGHKFYQYPFHLYAKNNVFISNSASIGSAIYISSNAILSNDSFIDSCKFISNTADTKGIITILFQYGTLNISNSLFITNQADNGSALYFKHSKLSSLEESKLILYYCNFTGNSGQSILRTDDFIIYSYIETVECIFQNNEGIALYLVHSYWKDTKSVLDRLTTTTGAVYLTTNSTADCEFTIFTNNTAKVHGGAISALGNSYFKCNQCNFYQNRAINGGVICFEQFSYFLIENSNFSNNLCTDRGAVIYAVGSDIYSSLKNSKLFNNYAESEGFIYLISSNIEIDNCEIWDNTAGKLTPGIYLTLSKAIIINSQFHDQEGNYGSFLYLTSDSELIVLNSSFISGKSYISGGSIYALSSSLNLEKSVFENSISNTGSAILSFSTSLNISQCQFLNMHSSDFGGVISISSGSDIFIEKSFFENFTNSAIEGSKIESLKVIETSFKNSFGTVGGAISCTNTDYILIDSCNFKNSTSLYGGALYFTFALSKINSKPYEVISTEFENNTSSAGGAIFADNININIELCRFYNNIAMSIEQTSGIDTDSGIGGAIKFGCSDFENCDFNVFSNDFVGNTADYEGGAVIWKEVMPKFENNSYENNLAEYGENIASYPVSMKILNSNWIGGLKDLASGQQIKTPLIIALIDHLGSIVTTDDSSVGEIISLSKDVVLSGDLKVSAVNGVFNFSSFIISALPGSNFSVEIQTDGIDSSKSVKANDGLIYNSSMIVGVYLRECELGEATIGNDCVICPKDFYSLDTKDEQCSACPNEAICYGNYTMVPKPGYWKSDMLSKKIWSCPNSNACIGSDPQNISYTGNCDKGYTGNLCQSCSDGYYKIAKNQCGKCESLSIVIIKTIGTSLVFLIVWSIMVLMSKKSAYKPKSLSSIYLKILINYIQLVSLTTAFNFSWPNYVKHLFSVQNNSNYISGDQIFSFDCFFYYKEVLRDTAIFYQKLLIMAILPILIPFIAVIFWSLILICKRNIALLIDHIITTCIIALFLIHPSIIKYYFSSYDCRELDYSKYWLAEDLSLQCWNGDHAFYTKNIALPAMLLWGIGIPTACFIILTKNKEKLTNINVRIKYGFLFNGYNSKSYYWEFVIIYRKVIIICCTIFLEAVSVKIQALTTIFVLVSCLYLHCKINPYNEDDLNRLEAISILASAITIYCGLYYLTGSLDSFAELIFFIIIISAHLFFAIYWIIKAGNVYITMIILKIPYLRRKFRKQRYNIIRNPSGGNWESTHDLILSSTNMENLNEQGLIFKEIKMKHLFLENLKGYVNIMDENAIENERSEEIDKDNASSKEDSLEVENMESNSYSEKLVKKVKAEEKNNKASLEEASIEEIKTN